MGTAINIRPATYSDILAVPIERGYSIIPPDEAFPSEEWFSDHARAVEKDDHIIAVFGVKPIWPGVGHCFAYIDKDATKYPKTLIISGRKMVEEASAGFGFWRLQSTVEANFNRGIRYLMAMGFNIDGLMPQFGPDRSDHLMMSRLINV